MTPVDIARQYLDAWNARDVAAIAKTFAVRGTYSDPVVGKLPGDAMHGYLNGLWGAFPDLSFEIVGVAEAGAGKVVAEWIMNGTNTGAFQGLPPTGRSVSVPGVDVILIGAGGIESVTGYFDSRAVPEQLGLQVLVQPFQLGPFSFGNSTAVATGRKTKPGAFAITAIWSADDQIEEIRTLTRQTAVEMLKMDGFIGASFVRIGGRGVTITAWEKPEQASQLRRGGTHPEAMQRFWSGLGDAGYTSVWVPDRINPLWVRCTACNKMTPYEKNAGVCGCGQQLPEPPAYF